MKYSMMICWCVVALFGSASESHAETVEVKKKVECFYCKGTGVAREKVKETCSSCGGQGYFIQNNGSRVVSTGIGGTKIRKNVDTQKNCRACGSRGYNWVSREGMCKRCNGVGYEVHTTKKEIKRRPSQEMIERRQSAKQERFFKKRLEAFLETNTVNIVLWGSGVEGFTEDGLCFSCSHASNRLDNAIYKMKVVEVLPENRVVSDLVKSGLYDQKLNKMILFETLGGGYSLNDYLKEGTFYKFVGVKEYKDRFGRKKSLPCLKEIPEDEYNAFAEERVRSQFDTW